MAITDTATHPLLIDGEDVTAPRACTQSFQNDNEAFALANDTRNGVAASDKEPVVDTVWLDEHLAGGSETPHGGVKGSGFGKDMSMYALEENTAVKHAVSPR